jgi:threonine aldolase
MYRAMAESPLGDDVLGDDPTVQELESVAAETFGTEAAVYVPSGTMGNLISIGVHAGAGDEVIMEERSHVYNFEAAGSARLWGVQMRTLSSDRGTMDPAEVAAAVRPDNIHSPHTGLICVENTHNFHGGAIVSFDNIKAISEIARNNGLKFHIDGARIMNASAATGVRPAEYAELADSLTFCLSKGLGAPVGSVIVGSKDFISGARRLRKVLGGAMRQAGVIAAAGVVALTEPLDHLAKDHRNARFLAKGLAGIDGVVIDVQEVETNIVMFRLEDGFPPYAEIMERLKTEGLLITSAAGLKLRMVTHRDVTTEDVEKALEILNRVIPESAKP